jgi:hypothetical protein
VLRDIKSLALTLLFFGFFGFLLLLLAGLIHPDPDHCSQRAWLDLTLGC